MITRRTLQLDYPSHENVEAKVKQVQAGETRRAVPNDNC